MIMNKEQALANILEKVGEFSLAVLQPLNYVREIGCEDYEGMKEYCADKEEELIATIKKELE